MVLPSRPALTFVAAFLLSASVIAQSNQPAALTADDYARAEQYMSYNTAPLVRHSGVRPTWTADDRFWYRTTGDNGAETWMVDPANATRVPCDLEACKAASPAEATGRLGVMSPDGKKTAFIR